MNEQTPIAAKVQGTPLTTLPQDLYIPPDALSIFLETFEGPLDLLLYLIQRQNLDILAIPIAEITRQYLHYITMMQALQLDLAAEYLVMAATLMEIKSRLLLPIPPTMDEASVQSPQAQLIEQLQTYARYKQAAQTLVELPQVGRDIFPVSVVMPPVVQAIVIPQLHLPALFEALQGVMQRVTLFSAHRVMREPLSVKERMRFILQCLQEKSFLDFVALLTLKEGRAGVVVTFLAILELTKRALIHIVQLDAFKPICITVQHNSDDRR